VKTLAGLALVAVIMVAVGALPLRTAHATCGEECDGQYSSAIDDCRSQYGDDPADADDLTNCVQQARDDYRSCLDDCASAAISPPRWGGLVAGTMTGLGRSLYPASGATEHRNSAGGAGN
jgi:hypothetical protein